MAERELSPVINIGDKTYYVNAKQADSTKGTLTIYENGPKKAVGLPSETKYFNGQADVEIGVVPSTGGTFEGPVFKTHTAENMVAVPSFAMLNKSEIGTLIAETKGAGWFTWNRSNQELTPAALDVSGNQHFGVVVGSEAALIAEDNPDTGELNFMSFNNKYEILPRFLYICGVSGKGSEVGNLYYGELGLTEPVRLAPSAEEVEIANIAKKLENSTIFIADLGRITPYAFDGTPSTTTPAKIGVTGKLAIANGGTNAANEQDACDNLISEQNISPKTIRLSAGDNDRVHRNDSSSGAYNRFGIDLCYSDIVRLNALYFGTQANSAGEGLNFVHKVTSDNKPETWDRLYAKNGYLYFDYGGGDGTDLATPNNQTGTEQVVYHSGCIIPESNGGTGKGNLAEVTVGKADKIKTSTGTYTEIVVSSTKPSNNRTKGTIWVQLPG